MDGDSVPIETGRGVSKDSTLTDSTLAQTITPLVGTCHDAAPRDRTPNPALSFDQPLGIEGYLSRVTQDLALASFLIDHRDKIAEAWASAIFEKMPHSNYARQWAEDLVAAFRWGIETNAAMLREGRSNLLRGTGLASFGDLVRMGFDIAEVIQAGLMQKRALMRIARQASDLDPDTLLEWSDRQDELAEIAVAAFARAYEAQANANLRLERDRTAQLLAAIQTASASLRMGEVLDRVARLLVAATAAEECRFCLVGDDGQPIAMWLGDKEWPGPGEWGFLTPTGAHQPAEGGLIDQVVATRKPLTGRGVLPPVNPGPGTSSPLAVKSLLVIPFLLEGRVVAVGVISAVDGHVFEAPEIELSCGIASATALAIENARLHERMEQVAVLEERARLAREMHDRLAQTLSYLNLKVFQADELLAAGDVENARAVLHTISEVVADADCDVREAIFFSRAPLLPPDAFFPALCAHVAEYRTRYGLDVRLELEPQSWSSFSQRLAAELTPVILESLINARRHGAAERAVVRFSRRESWMEVVIEDDGRGFDPEAVVVASGGHFGLQIMRERVTGMGGMLNIESHIGKGTRIVIRVPQTELP